MFFRGGEMSKKSGKVLSPPLRRVVCKQKQCNLSQPDKGSKNCMHCYKPLDGSDPAVTLSPSVTQSSIQVSV